MQLHQNLSLFLQFTQSREGRLGLLVTVGSKYLPLSPNIDTAIVGQCACYAASKEITELSSLDLPTPDWETTVASVGHHFPAGFESCSGVWFRVDSGESEGEINKAYLTKVLNALMNATNLKVHDIILCNTIRDSPIIKKIELLETAL